MPFKYRLIKKNLNQNKMKMLLMTCQSKWVFERLWQIVRVLKATHTNKVVCVPGKDQVMPSLAFLAYLRFYYRKRWRQRQEYQLLKACASTDKLIGKGGGACPRRWRCSTVSRLCADVHKALVRSLTLGQLWLVANSCDPSNREREGL